MLGHGPQRAERVQGLLRTLDEVTLQQAGPVTLFTSDEDDMRKLCDTRVTVVKL
jgi:hypothetical protein